MFLGLACLTALVAGCFTEVGNAEDELVVNARFSIDYNRNPIRLKPASGSITPDSVCIDQFYLPIQEIEYTAAGADKQHLWRDTAGIPVDFTGNDSLAALPAMKVVGDSWTSLILEYRIPSLPDLRMDTVEFASFRNRGYIKGTVHIAGNAGWDFLFALPKMPGVKMTYSGKTLASWHTDNIYNLKFVFFATYWISAANLVGAKQVPDRNGVPVLLLDAKHNPEFHKALSDRFFKSFNTLQVELN
jgi:hypothetical protein